MKHTQNTECHFFICTAFLQCQCIVRAPAQTYQKCAAGKQESRKTGEQPWPSLCDLHLHRVTCTYTVSALELHLHCEPPCCTLSVEQGAGLRVTAQGRIWDRSVGSANTEPTNSLFLLLDTTTQLDSPCADGPHQPGLLILPWEAALVRCSHWARLDR